MEDGARQVATPAADPPSLREIIRMGRQADGARAIEEMSQQALEVFEPGERIPGSQYDVQRLLGEGDSAVLYEVCHAQIRKRAVAKILKSSLRGKPEGQRRFRDAARAVNQIGSPNIVEIFDFIILPDRRVMLIMELLDGETIASVARRGPMAPERALGILRQTCKALAAAHATGHVHQNIEPDNIMLIAGGPRPDFVKLLGFAFGVPMEAGRPGGGRRYASPEELVGSDVDLRADVYALGCTAHWMLTGLEPNLGRPPALPGPLWDVIERCLSEEPAERYADMADLEAALCEAQIQLQVVTPWDHLPVPEVAPERRARIMAGMAELGRDTVAPRRRWLLPAAGFAVVLALTGVGLALSSSDSVSAQEQSQLDLLVSEAHAAAAKAYYVYPSLHEPDHPTAYSKVVELESIEGAQRSPARERAEQLREEFARTLFRLGDRYWEQEGGRRFAQGYYEQGLMFDPEHEQARERSGRSAERISRLSESAAELSFDEEDLADAEPLLVLAEDDPQERTRKMDELRERRLAQAEAEVAALQTLSGQAGADPAPAGIDGDEPAAGSSSKGRRGRSRGRNDRKRVVAVLESYLDSTDEGDEAELIESLLTVMHERGSSKSGKRKSSKAATGPRDPEAAAQHVATGRRKLGRGDYKGAEQAFHRALEADHRSAAAMAGLGEVYFERGAYQKAVIYHRRAVNAAPKKASYRMRLGDSYFKVLRYGDAKKQYAKAKALGHRQAAAALEKVQQRLRG